MMETNIKAVPAVFNSTILVKKQQLIGLLGFLLLLFCILVVIWQVFMGTKKYLDAPVANTIYAEEVELPVITICHRIFDMRVEPKYGLEFSDFKAGNI